VLPVIQHTFKTFTINCQVLLTSRELTICGVRITPYNNFFVVLRDLGVTKHVFYPKPKDGTQQTPINNTFSSHPYTLGKNERMRELPSDNKRDMNNPKKQHWVPQFYLRSFSTLDTIQKKPEEQQVYAQDVGGEYSMFKSKISDIAAKKYLYSPLDTDTGVRSWEIEAKFSQFEDHISKVWPYFVKYDLPISGDEQNDIRLPHGDNLRKAISMFVMNLYLRNIYNKEVINSITKSLIEQFDKIPKDENGYPDVTQVQIDRTQVAGLDVSDWHQFKDNTPKFVDEVFLDIAKTGDVDILHSIYKKRWQVLVSAEKHFITCDTPVVVRNPDRGMENSTVVFPLSPRKCIYMSNDIEEGYIYDVDEHIAIFNGMIAAGAVKHVYSHKDPLHAFVEIQRHASKYLSGA
jgi:hypothetical protein